jgi:dihydrofolate reductase
VTPATVASSSGRRTYQDLYRVWPHRTDNPFTDRLNTARKYVASRTLSEPLSWENSTRLSGDVITEVRRLRERISGDLVVIGSGALLRSLMAHGLLDELLLAIHPVVLGTGRRLFPAGRPRLALRLMTTTPTTTGVVIARYERADGTARPTLR